MAKLKIITYGNSILQKNAEEVGEITPEIQQLIQDMIETMEAGEGAGLAAPQVGILKRIIVVQTESGAFGFVNPKIVKISSPEENIEEEGCLSMPGFRLKIKRPIEVIIETLDAEGKKATIEAKGLIARIFQHEIEHLDGVLIIDHLRGLAKITAIIKYRFFS